MTGKPKWASPILGPTHVESTLERRSTLKNDNDIEDGENPPAFYTQIDDKGKFFPRGCRGKIKQILVYCKRTSVGAIQLQYSPHPCLGPVKNLLITPGDDWGWVATNPGTMWDYDSLFIWIYLCSDDVSWAYDAEQPWDGHKTTTDGSSWKDMNIRPFIRVVFSGQTPGDVPVSGIVNTIEIPGVASEEESGVGVDVPSGIATMIFTIEGTGTLLAASLTFDTSIAPTAGEPPDGVVYLIQIYVDGAYALSIGNRELTQSCTATSGRAPDGVFLQGTVANPAWDMTFIKTLIPIGFRHTIALYAYQSTGGAVDVLGNIYINKLV